MKTEKKRYKIEIFGEEYTIVSDEQEDRIVKSAEMVDLLMKQIVESSQSADIKKVAVLVALRMANDALLLQQELESVQQKQEQLLKQVDQELLSISSQ
jgi:cell division protein ZapA